MAAETWGRARWACRSMATLAAGKAAQRGEGEKLTGGEGWPAWVGEGSGSESGRERQREADRDEASLGSATTQLTPVVVEA
jgi:hypothetical protein